MAAKRYRAWLYLEEIDDEKEDTDVCGPCAVGDFDTYQEGERFFRALVTTLAPEDNGDYAYPLAAKEEDNGTD